MFEVFWYWFIAMLKGGVTVKMRIATDPPNIISEISKSQYPNCVNLIP